MKPTRLNRQSDKAKGNAQRRREVVAAARRRDHNRCVGRERVPEVQCWGQLQPHERIRRAQWPSGIYVLDNVVMVCEGHHRWVTECLDLDRARRAGLYAYSHERDDLFPTWRTQEDT